MSWLFVILSLNDDVLEIMQMCCMLENLCLCNVQLSCVRGGASCKARG